ncbi:MAG: PAS domain S-box protein [Candidatus Marinimicrobia bacterium]|nr:PAS domain S-box protein [Candidatus Neomarinimicrobiota bacterium]
MTVPIIQMLLFLNALLCSALAVLAWQRRPVTGATAFTLLLLGIIFYATGYAIELGSVDLSGKILSLKVMSLGLLIPTALLVFVLQFTGHTSLLNWKLLALLALEPVTTFVLALSTERHDFLFSDISMVTTGTITSLKLTPGAWGRIDEYYTAILVLICIALLAHSAITSHKKIRRQAQLFLVAILIPWLANRHYLITDSHIDFTSFGFLFSVIIIAWGFYRHQLMNLIPAARHRIVETIDYLILILDEDGTIVDINEAAGKMLGFRSKEAIGIRVGDMQDKWPQLIQQIANPEPRHIDISFKSGKEIQYWDLRVSPLLGHLGSREFWTVTLYNITDRKQADAVQTALYQISDATNSTDSLVDLLKQIHSIINSLILAENFYVALYDKINDIYRFPYFVDEMDEPSDPQPLRGSLTDYIRRTQKPQILRMEDQKRLEESGEAKTIGTISLIWLGAPLKTPKGVIGVVAVQSYDDPNAYDHDDLNLLNFVSDHIAMAIERKTAEEELLQLKQGLEHTEDAIFVTDLKGKILTVNPAFEKLYGFTTEEAIGKTPRILKSGRHPEEVYQKVWATLLNKEVAFMEFINKTKDGRLIQIESRANAILDSDGNILGFLAIQRDVTEKRELQEQAVQEEKLESVRSLAGAISHEFNQPLQALSAISSLALEGDDENRDYMIANIPVQVERISELVKKLKNITSLQTKPYLKGDSIIDLDESDTTPPGEKDTD